MSQELQRSRLWTTNLFEISGANGELESVQAHTFLLSIQPVVIEELRSSLHLLSCLQIPRLRSLTSCQAECHVQEKVWNGRIHGNVTSSLFLVTKPRNGHHN